MDPKENTQTEINQDTNLNFTEKSEEEKFDQKNLPKENLEKSKLDLVESESQNKNISKQKNFNNSSKDSKSQNSLIFTYKVLTTILVLSTLFFASFSGYLLYSNFLRKDPNYDRRRDEVSKILNKYSITSIPSDEVLEAGELNGLVTAVGDPYSSYISKQKDEEFQDSLNQRYEGVGIRFDQVNGQTTVQEVFENSPAQRGGVAKNDILKKIDDKEIINLDINSIAEKIRGPQGSVVKLEFETKDKNNVLQIKALTLTRDKISTNLISLEFKEDVAIIRITSFGQNLDQKMRQVSDEILQNKNIKGIVIDLRGNGGGLLNESIEVISYFTDPDQVAVIEKTKNEEEILKTTEKTPNLKNYPTVVLIDKYTASASEIMAGALRDIRQTKLIGQKSFGKGTVQQIFTLQNKDKLKVTIAEWFTPKRTQINKQGLEPDVNIKSEEDSQKIGINELKKIL